MNIIAIDASLDLLNIGLGKDDKLIASFSLNNPRQYTALLYKYIGLLLEKGRITIKDIDCFAVVVGPGSFTGTRIAVTAAKAFAYALNKDVVALKSLDLVALNALSLKGNTVVSLIDGKRDNLYFAKYNRGRNGFKIIGDYMLVSLEEVKAKLGEVDIILGDGIEVLKKRFVDLDNDFNFLDNNYWSIKPKSMISLAFNHWNSQEAENIFDLKPLYIYPKECTIKGPY